MVLMAACGRRRFIWLPQDHGGGGCASRPLRVIPVAFAPCPCCRLRACPRHDHPQDLAPPFASRGRWLAIGD